MSVFQDAVDVTFAAFGLDATYTPLDGEPVPVRVIVKRPEPIKGFHETRLHDETAVLEVRASGVASPQVWDQLTVGGRTFVVRGEPVQPDPDGLLWRLNAAVG